MLEQPQPISPELTLLPIVVDGELTDNFTSPDLLEEPPQLEPDDTPASETAPAALVVAEVVDVDNEDYKN